MEDKILEIQQDLKLAISYIEDNEMLEEADLVKCGRAMGLAIAILIDCEEKLDNLKKP